MAKYIDAEKLIAEIERHINHYESSNRDDFKNGELYICQELLSFIKSLQQKQPSLPDSLDEAANKFAVLYDQGTCDGIAQECFKAGANWQKEKDTRDMVMSDNRQFQKVYELGKKDMMEKMMKEKINEIIRYLNEKEENNEQS